MDQHILQQLCRTQLELSGVHEGELVAVLSQGHDRLDYADAFINAAQTLGAKTYHMRVPEPAPDGKWAVGVTPLAGNPEAIEALKQADILVDLIFLLFSEEQMAIQAAGTPSQEASHARAGNGRRRLRRLERRARAAGGGALGRRDR